MARSEAALSQRRGLITDPTHIVASVAQSAAARVRAVHEEEKQRRRCADWRRRKFKIYQTFDAMLQRLREYKATNGHVAVQPKEDEELAKWVRNIRHQLSSRNKTKESRLLRDNFDAVQEVFASSSAEAEAETEAANVGTTSHPQGQEGGESKREGSDEIQEQPAEGSALGTNESKEIVLHPRGQQDQRKGSDGFHLAGGSAAGLESMEAARHYISTLTSKKQANFDRMFDELTKFKKENGHTCATLAGI